MQRWMDFLVQQDVSRPFINDQNCCIKNEILLVSGNYWMDNVFCSGKESELSHCRFSGWGKSDCESSEAAGVICQAVEQNYRSRSANKNIRKIKIKDAQMHRVMRIRLTGGRTKSEGRVELKFGKSGKANAKWNNKQNIQMRLQQQLYSYSIVI